MKVNFRFVVSMVFAVVTSLASAHADPITLRISAPALASDWHGKMFKVFKDTLEAARPGEFNVQIHLNASLFKQGKEAFALQLGYLEMAQITPQDLANQIPEWSVFTAGYLLRDPRHLQNVFQGEIGQEFFGMVSDRMKIKILGVGYIGTRQLNLRGDKVINVPDDLKGVKLRMPGSNTWQFLGSALGANPTPMAFGEVYMALQTGAIDGQDNPLPTDMVAKFYEVTDQIILTSHLVGSFFLAMSHKMWDRLNGDQQVAVLHATKVAMAYNDKNRIEDEARLVAFFRGEGLKVYEPDRESFRSRVQNIYMKSKYAKDWPVGIIDRINAVE